MSVVTRSQFPDWVWQGNRLSYTGSPRTTRPGTTYIAIDLHAPHLGYFGISGGAAVLASNLAEVEQAMRSGWTVATVHYNECLCLTHPMVRNRLIGYPGWVEVGKDQWNGAPELVAALEKRGCGTSVLRLGGVMTDKCVSETACGLASVYPSAQIDIATHACATTEPHFSWNESRDLRAHSNIFLVSGVCPDAHRHGTRNVTAMLASRLRGAFIRA